MSDFCKKEASPPTVVKLPKLRAMRGIRLISRVHTKRNIREWYVEATHPKHGVASRRIYIGNDRTWTAERIRSAVQEAKTLRNEWKEIEPC